MIEEFEFDEVSVDLRNPFICVDEADGKFHVFLDFATDQKTWEAFDRALREYDQVLIHFSIEQIVDAFERNYESYRGVVLDKEAAAIRDDLREKLLAAVAKIESWPVEE